MSYRIFKLVMLYSFFQHHHQNHHPRDYYQIGIRCIHQIIYALLLSLVRFLAFSLTLMKFYSAFWAIVLITITFISF